MVKLKNGIAQDFLTFNRKISMNIKTITKELLKDIGHNYSDKCLDCYQVRIRADRDGLISIDLESLHGELLISTITGDTILINFEQSK